MFCFCIVFLAVARTVVNVDDTRGTTPDALLAPCPEDAVPCRVSAAWPFSVGMLVKVVSLDERSSLACPCWQFGSRRCL